MIRHLTKFSALFFLFQVSSRARLEADPEVTSRKDGNAPGPGPDNHRCSLAGPKNRHLKTKRPGGRALRGTNTRIFLHIILEARIESAHESGSFACVMGT